MCLLKEVEVEEGLIGDLIGVSETWWKQWFLVIRRWNEFDIDDGRVIWDGVYGVPIHAWNVNFFVALANLMGSFICLDESTTDGSNLDTIRFMARVQLAHVLEKKVLVQIDGKEFALILKGDATGSMRDNPCRRKSYISVSESAKSEDEWSVNCLDYNDVVNVNDCSVDASMNGPSCDNFKDMSVPISVEGGAEIHCGRGSNREDSENMRVPESGCKICSEQALFIP